MPISAIQWRHAQPRMCALPCYANPRPTEPSSGYLTPTFAMGGFLSGVFALIWLSSIQMGHRAIFTIHPPCTGSGEWHPTGSRSPQEDMPVNVINNGCESVLLVIGGVELNPGPITPATQSSTPDPQEEELTIAAEISETISNLPAPSTPTSTVTNAKRQRASTPPESVTVNQDIT